MDRDDLTRQGKQMASDLRDTVSQKVSQNEDTIKSTLDKAARWVDQKTGGKYSDQIGKAQARVGDGVGWVASQGPTSSGEPAAPGASAGDPAPTSASTATPSPASEPTPSPTPKPSPTPTPTPKPSTPPTAADDEAPRPPQV